VTLEHGLDISGPRAPWTILVLLALSIPALASIVDRRLVGTSAGLVVGMALVMTNERIRNGGSVICQRASDLSWVVLEQQYCQLCEDVQRDLEDTVRESLGDFSIGFRLRDHVDYAEQTRLWSNDDRRRWSVALRLRKRILTEPDARPSMQALTTAVGGLHELKAKLHDRRLQIRAASSELNDVDEIQVSNAAERLRG